MFKKIKLSINTFFENIKLIKIDKTNRKKFIIEIGREISNPSSKFNLYELAMDSNFEKLSCYITIPENFQLGGTDAMIYLKLQEEARPINEYIGRDIMWGEYFKLPNYYYLEDSEDTKNVSCTYLAIWEYAPVLKGNKKFWRQFASFISLNSLLIAGIIIGLIIVL